MSVERQCGNENTTTSGIVNGVKVGTAVAVVTVVLNVRSDKIVHRQTNRPCTCLLRNLIQLVSTCTENLQRLYEKLFICSSCIMVTCHESIAVFHNFLSIGT